MSKFSAACSIAGAFSLVVLSLVSSPSLAAEAAGASLTTPSITSATQLLDAVTDPIQLTPALPVDPAVLAADDKIEAVSSQEAPVAAKRAASLNDLVAEHAASETQDDEHECLATSVYYESKGEPLHGQLAVAETVVNRAKSGRFPASACAVIRQPGQFSFVRRGSVPQPPKTSAAWRTAVAVALIARNDMWKDVAPEALFFHATRVSPRWTSAKRIARLGNHVFYR